MNARQIDHRPTPIEWTGWAACAAMLHALALAALVALAIIADAFAPAQQTETGADHIAAHKTTGK